MAEKYGPLVRLWGIHPSQLPPSTATPQELVPFLASILNEALPFISSLPASSSPSASSPWKTKGTKHYAHSIAPVYLYERTVPADALQAVAKEHHDVPHLADAKPALESWFLRRSTHEDAAKTGTATWAEWVRAFKDGHAEAEKEFTPTVLRTAVRREWDCAGATVALGDDTWEDWTLKLEESVHKMPAPLKDRVFPVLQATAAVRGRREFIVVQIAAAQGPGEEEEVGLVRAAYTSVERLRELEAETGPTTEWVMGTASDAKGSLPPWVQKMAVPGKVAKDVDMFLFWISNERKGKQKEEVA